MKNNLFLIAFFLIFSSCTGNQSETEENTIKLECLESEEKKFVNSILTLFEKQLMDKYGETSYKQFLFEMKDMAIPPEFFVNSDLTEFLMEKRTSPVFRKIWMNQEGAYLLNTDSQYFQCLKQSSKSKVLTDVLETVDQVPNIGMNLIAGALESELPDADYDKEAVKLYLAVNIYSEFSLNIYDSFK